MKSTRFLLATACAATLSLGQAFAGGEGWSSDFAASQKKAADEDKVILVDFTGSDWCSWCIKLNEEVFDHDAFKNGVKDKFVLVELDYPRDKSKLSEETQKQNEELQKKFSVSGFPTILLLDSEGKPFARTGYQAGGPEKYLTHLDELVAVKTTRDEAFASAAKLEGVAKAEAIVSALKAMELEDELVATFYAELAEQIKAADPKDETGYIANLESKQKYADFENELNGFARTQDHEGALALVNKTLEAGTFEGEQQQQITFIKGMIYAQSGKMDEAVAALDEAKAVDPDSKFGKRIDQIKANMLKQQADAAAKEAPAADDTKKEGE